MQKWCSKIEYGIIIIESVLMLFLVFFLVRNDDQQNRLGNLPLLLLTLAVMGTVMAAGILLKKYINWGTRLFLNEKRLLLVYGVLFLLQLAMAWYILFYTGWDVGLMKMWVEFIVAGSGAQEINLDLGYSIYPNNLLLFYIQYLLEKIALLFKMEEPYQLCIIVSCLCVNIGCYLGHSIVVRLTGSRLFSGIYLGAACGLILFSPWIVIPYSDTYGMLFVMLAVWAMVRIDNLYAKWIVCVGSSLIGYQIKPTCIFVLFAVTLVWGIRYLCLAKWKSILTMAASAVVFLILTSAIPLFVQRTFSFQLDPEAKMPFTHFMMMGLNSYSNGGYYHEDYLYSSSFPTLEERKKANVEEFQRRIEEYGREGLTEFYRVKALYNFNDGTFAWGMEGQFYNEVKERNNPVSAALRSYFHFSTEDKGSLFYNLTQGLWLFTLLGMGLLMFSRKSFSAEKASMAVMLGGLMVFVMLFEARARYLYLYSPVFVVLAVTGFWGCYRLIACRRSNSGRDSHGVVLDK